MNKKTGGHPAKKDPLVAKVYQTMRNSVELVRDLNEHLTKEQMEYLRGSVVIHMEIYSILTGKPSAIGLILNDEDVKF